MKKLIELHTIIKKDRYFGFKKLELDLKIEESGRVRGTIKGQQEWFDMENWMIENTNVLTETQKENLIYPLKTLQNFKHNSMYNGMHLVAHTDMDLESVIDNLYEKYMIYKKQYQNVDFNEFSALFWNLKSQKDLRGLEKIGKSSMVKEIKIKTFQKLGIDIVLESLVKYREKFPNGFENRIKEIA